jgi:hypothetical protein
MNDDISNLSSLGRISGVKRKRIETPAQIASRNFRAKVRRAAKRKIIGETTLFKDFYELGKLNTEDACLEYVELFQGIRITQLRPEGWLSKPSPYPGREHIDILNIGKLWLPIMTNWLNHRIHVQGFESSRETKTALHLLADYLFLYLPWWKELHPKSLVNIILAPKNFLRIQFVSRTTIENKSKSESEKLPITLLDFISLRRIGPDGRNKIVSSLERFFQYVITAYVDQYEITGSKMNNPIQLLFDKKKSSRRTKTNKIPFDENVFPHLIHYGQAVEAFGEYLMQLAYEINFFDEKPYGELYGFDTEKYGYIPFVLSRGKLFKIKWIPNVYHFSRRLFQSNPVGHAGFYINGCKMNTGDNKIRQIHLPQLTTLRLLMGLIETGLRGQGIQWLDRRTWDVKNSIKSSLKDLYTNNPLEKFTLLHINTDKSKSQPWTAYISWRLRRSLLSEQYFQESTCDLDINIEVNYENRLNSRFLPVVPLFRSSRLSTPFTDGTYYETWIQLLVGFQSYYNSMVAPNSEVCFLELTRMPPNIDGSPKVISGKYGFYCPIKFNPINTPHSCRATYATLRDGDFEISEIAEQLGHDSTITTNYYQVPSAKSVKAKLEKFDNDMITFSGAFDSSYPTYIHAERQDSALQSSFSIDRESAIASYGFISGVSFWSTDDVIADDMDALEILKNSPASSIKWHTTHVCPVGNQCPSDIVVKIGGYRRCGLCNLAAKCVDHLPAISAKKRELIERIRAITRNIKKLEVLGDESSLNHADALYREKDLDAKEFTGWTLSEEILLHRYKQLAEHRDEEVYYHTDSPEIVRKHLQLISKKSSESEFLIQRIADAHAYPSMESKEVRARAGMMVRKLLAKAGRIDEALSIDFVPEDEIQMFVSLVKPMLLAKGFLLEDLVSAMINPRLKIQTNAENVLLS